MGFVISIVNNKGGVGKTTICCNLAVALSYQKMRILVIDVDSQCNATGILLPSYINIRYSLYELLDINDQEKVSIENCIYLSKYKGLYCLPNVEETSGLELDLISKYPDSLRYLRDRIREYVKNNYDITIIDNPPNMGIFVANSLFASDLVIVPIDAGSAYSLDGLRKAMDLVMTIKETGNPDLKFFKLLINKLDKRTAISKTIIDDIKTRFDGSHVFKTVIPFNTAIQKAEYAKHSIFRYNSNSRAARAFKQLAKEVLLDLKNLE